MSDDQSTMPLLEKNARTSSQNQDQSINYVKRDVENQQSIVNNIENDNMNASQVKGIENFDNPIERYNLVIDQYNNIVNQIDGIQLSLLSKSYLVAWFNKIFTKPSSRWFLSLFLLLASGLNLLLFLLMVVTFLIYLSSFRTHKKNEEKIPDPFMKMIYCEEMCENLNVSWYYFKLDVEGMSNFSFNFDTMKFIKDRIKDTMVEFMIYDIKFYENYTQFVKVKGRFIRWLFVSLFLIAINAGVVFLIYDMAIIKNV